MSRDIPESDWRLFRQLHAVAFDRYCQRLLQQIDGISDDATRSPRERYLAIYKLIQKKDRELGRAFDDLRRSTAIMQLAIVYSHGVITEDELARFTPKTRESILVLSTKK